VRRAAFPLVAAVVAAALVALLAFGLSRNGDGGLDAAVARGERPQAPAATLPVLGSDATRSLSSFRGKVVVLNVFASWCAPCRTEAPMLADAQHELARRGATVVGVTYDDTEPDALAFVHRYGLRYPVLRDVDQDVGKDLAVKGVPETFVLDKRGRIAALRRGPVTRSFVDDAVRKASAS
jgi:cytochrome c biogenesis protein CcmG, thiol:disulfide interchange protein DsbE